MHILYIHQHFATPEGSTGTRSYEFASRWVKARHKVTLITGHYDIGGLKLGKGLIQTQTINQINVLVVGTSYSNKQSFMRRIVSFLCFMLFSIYAGLRTKDVDIIYASSTPLTVGIPAMVIKWLKRKPFVFEVRDQWPASPIEVGVLKNKLLIKILLGLERLIYKKAAAIVALSDGMAEGIRQIAPKGKDIFVVPNGADLDLFRPDIDGSPIRKQYGWVDKLVFLHTGAMGRINDLCFVIKAAEKLKEYHDILFVLVGDGNQKSVLRNKVRELNLANVEFLESVPKKQLPAILAASDVVTAIIGNFPIIERHASLNKFYDGLSCGKPLLLNYSGWQRELIEKADAGLGCGLCDLDEFIQNILYLNKHREKLPGMGHNARRLAEKNFNREELAMCLENILRTMGEKT